MNPLLSTVMPCPCGGSVEPMTLPSLSMWIMDGGSTQQSAIGGVSSASSSISVRSFGRSCTQTLSSLSTANPVTPPIFHLFGKGFGQSASTLYFGAFCVCAPRAPNKTNKHRPAARPNAINLLSLPMDLPLIIRWNFYSDHPGGHFYTPEASRKPAPAARFDNSRFLESFLKKSQKVTFIKWDGAVIQKPSNCRCHF